MMRESTEEEIEVGRRFRASMCPGDGVHTDTMRWHDWRLWRREPIYTPDVSPDSIWSKLTGHDEQWYCTRCRKIEERTVMLDGS
jgi:hypothetical protein